MMGYWGSYGYGGMMNFGFSFLGSIFWLVILTDLILLGVWLWKQINRK